MDSLFRALFISFNETNPTKEKQMLHPIRRTKQFVNDHNDAFFWTAGAFTGFVATYITMHNPHTTTYVAMTAEQAKTILNDRSFGISYDLPKQTINVAIVD